MPADFTTMNTPRFLYRACMQHPFPDWVASVAVPEQADFEKKASAAFADPVRRLLPICTKEAAFYSALNLFAHPEDFDDEAIFERVKEACEHFGIEHEISPYATMFVEQFEKEASASDFVDGRFAIDTMLDDTKFQLLPLNDADDVSVAAVELAKMASEKRVPIFLFVPGAREIVKAASDFGVPSLPELIVRYGVPKFADEAEARRLVAGREQLCKDATIRDTLAADYSEALNGVEDDPDAAMMKVAAIDYVAGIEPQYKLAARTPTPFDIVFSGTLVSEAEKAATENVMIRGVLIPLEEIKRLDAVDVDFKLNKSAAEVFHKLWDTDDAKDLSLAIECWSEEDQKTILRLVAA